MSASATQGGHNKDQGSGPHIIFVSNRALTFVNPALHIHVFYERFILSDLYSQPMCVLCEL